MLDIKETAVGFCDIANGGNSKATPLVLSGKGCSVFVTIQFTFRSVFYGNEKCILLGFRTNDDLRHTIRDGGASFHGVFQKIAKHNGKCVFGKLDILDIRHSHSRFYNFWQSAQNREGGHLLRDVRKKR